MAKRPTRRDIAQKRSQEVFTGRQQALDDFRQNLERPFDAENRKLIWMVSGEGGIGKTTLLRRYRTITSEHGYLSALVDEFTSPGILAVMGSLADELERQGHTLNPFADRYKAYVKFRSEIDSDPDQPIGRSAALGRAVGRVGMEVLRQVPIAGGVAVGLMGEKAMEEKPGEFAAFVARKLGNKEDTDMVLNPVDKLTPLFVESLSKIAEKYPVALFFDTYEKTCSYLDTWLSSMLEGKYGDLALEVLVIIAGRDELGQNWLSEYVSPFLHTLSLDPFTEEEALEYLARRGITDKKVVEVILKLSGRVPVLLATLATNPPENPDEIGDPTGEAVERFLKWVGEEKHRQAILTCALPRTINLDIMSVLLGEEQAKEMFPFIKGMSFVTQRVDAGWVYHDTVRQLMLHHRLQESQNQWRQLHTRLADYFAGERSALGLESIEGLRNPRWQSANLDWLYHTICAKQDNAVGDWIACTLDVLGHPDSSTEYSEKLGETIRQAGESLRNEGVKRWAEIISAGLVAWNKNEDPEKARAMLNALEEHAGNLEVKQRAIILSARGTIHYLLQDYAAAIGDFTRAVDLQPEIGDNYTWRGQTRFDLQDYAAAIADFTRAVDLQPENGDNYRGRGLAYYALQDYAAAIGDFTRATELQPEIGNNHWFCGRTHFDLQDYAAAIADFTRAVDLQPEIGDNYAWRGRAYYALQDYAAAVTDFTRAVELQPEDGDNYQGRGQMHYVLQDYAAAIADFTHAVDLQPENGDNYVWRGRMHYALQDYAAAIADLTRAVELQPENGDNYQGRGQTHYALQDYAAAIADFTRATELEPEDGDNYAWRGQTHYALQDYAAAVADFTCATELEPEDGDNYKGRGQTHYALQDYAAAVADFTRATELEPEDGYNYWWLGRIHYDLQDYAAALADFTRTVELQPEDGDNYFWRGRSHYDLQDYAAAIADYSRAIDLQPENGDNYGLRGLAHHDLQDYAAAIADYSRAIDLQPENGGNYHARGQTHHDLQDYAAAIADFTRAIELQPEDDYNYHWRGRTHYGLQDYAAATADFTRAIELQPEDGNNYWWRGLVYLNEDEGNAAFEDFSRACELNSKDAHSLFWRGVVHDIRRKSAEARQDWDRATEILRDEKDDCLRLRALAKLALVDDRIDSAREHYLQALDSTCQRASLVAERTCLRLLARLYPSRNDIGEMKDWFESQL